MRPLHKRLDDGNTFPIHVNPYQTKTFLMIFLIELDIPWDLQFASPQFTAQKSSSTTLPLYIASVIGFPSISLIATAGAICRDISGMSTLEDALGVSANPAFPAPSTTRDSIIANTRQPATTTHRVEGEIREMIRINRLFIARSIEILVTDFESSRSAARSCFVDYSSLYPLVHSSGETPQSVPMVQGLVTKPCVDFNCNERTSRRAIYEPDMLVREIFCVYQ